MTSITLSDVEKCLGTLACEKILSRGGVVTFAEYDALMYEVKYFFPISWIAGWGDPVLWKRNNDKLCAFAAVRMGLIRQTPTGYKVAKR